MAGGKTRRLLPFYKVFPAVSGKLKFFEFFCIFLLLFLNPYGIINELADTEHNIEAWLSLVERCVRDAEVASSNLVASIMACWSSG